MPYIHITFCHINGKMCLTGCWRENLEVSKMAKFASHLAKEQKIDMV